MRSVMSTSSSSEIDLPPDVLDQAIAWVVRLRAGNLNQAEYDRLKEQISVWRHAAPLHESAWQELNASEQHFAALPVAVSAHAMQTLQTMQQKRAIRSGRRKALGVLGLSGLGIGVMLTMERSPLHQWVDGFAADYATAKGERRTVALADGTNIRLNTDTAIDVLYTNAQRLIVLRKGEIFITTGKDADVKERRAFLVKTAHTQLEAIGTQFFVRQVQDRTRLLVTQGRVSVGSKNGVIANAGEGYLIEADGRVTRSSQIEDGYDALGWLDGALVAKQMRLADVLEQLSRYRRGWLRCDPAIADLRVSGVFQFDDTDRALEALVQTLPISLVRHTRYWVTLHPA